MPSLTSVGQKNTLSHPQYILAIIYPVVLVTGPHWARQRPDQVRRDGAARYLREGDNQTSIRGACRRSSRAPRYYFVPRGVAKALAQRPKVYLECVQTYYRPVNAARSTPVPASQKQLACGQIGNSSTLPTVEGQRHWRRHQYSTNGSVDGDRAIPTRIDLTVPEHRSVSCYTKAVDLPNRLLPLRRPGNCRSLVLRDHFQCHLRTASRPGCRAGSTSNLWSLYSLIRSLYAVSSTLERRQGSARVGGHS